MQFAKDVGGCKYAIKFLFDRASYITEAALYAAASPHLRSNGSPELTARVHVYSAKLTGVACEAVPMAEAVGRFLPQVEALCDGSMRALDPRGRPLPPCIVMEKGESLQDWSDRAEPDVFTILAVRALRHQLLADSCRVPMTVKLYDALTMSAMWARLATIWRNAFLAASVHCKV